MERAVSPIPNRAVRKGNISRHDSKSAVSATLIIGIALTALKLVYTTIF